MTLGQVQYKCRICPDCCFRNLQRSACLVSLEMLAHMEGIRRSLEQRLKTQDWEWPLNMVFKAQRAPYSSQWSESNCSYFTWTHDEILYLQDGVKRVKPPSLLAWSTALSFFFERERCCPYSKPVWDFPAASCQVSKPSMYAPFHLVFLRAAR